MIKIIWYDWSISIILFSGEYIPLQYQPEIKNITLLKIPSKTYRVNIGTNLNIPKTSNIMLICPINIHDFIHVKWEKDNEIFRGTRYHNDGTVLVTDLNINHTGRYICYNDDYTKYEFGSIHINVLCKFNWYFVMNKVLNRFFL